MTIATGRFVWFEYDSADPKKAQGFFGELFHWGTKGMPIPGGGEYPMITLGNDMLGGYPPARGGHAAWVTHLQVQSTKDSAAKVKALGGKVLVPPVDMGMGTYALVSDPFGASFALWQPAKPEGTGDYKNVANAFCWNELGCADPAKAVAFYQAIGGFEVSKMEMPDGTYYQLLSEGKGRAGIRAHSMPGAPTAWLPYVHVTSADKIVEQATRLGARVVMTATDIPTIGRIAIFLDPQGVGLGILQPAA